MSERIVLDDTDVVSMPAVSASMYNFGLISTFKVEELIEWARKWIAQSGHESGAYSYWLTRDGLRCQVLQSDGRGWKPGRVMFRIEFVPDQPNDLVEPITPVSPLDDLRSSLKLE